MKLDKLYSEKQIQEIGNEIRKLYLEDGWNKAQIRQHFNLTYDTLTEFCKLFDIKKTPAEYNKKNIDKKYTKEELDALAQYIRKDFLDNLLTLPEIEKKYNLTFTECESIRKRYGIKESTEQHWERTKKANLRIHGVDHMSYIEGHTEKAYATYKKHYIDNEVGRNRLLRKRKQTNIERFGTPYANSSYEVQLRYAKTTYGDKFIGEEQFKKVFDAFRDRDKLVNLINEVAEENRNYHYFSKVWQQAEHTIYKAFKQYDLENCLFHSIHNVSSIETNLYDRLCKLFPNKQILRNVRNIIPPQELDIYIPELKFAIEVNGDYWHSDEFVPIDYHQNKSIGCLDAGIQLYHVWEHEFVNNPNRIVNDIIESSRPLNSVDTEVCLDMRRNNGARLVDVGYYVVGYTSPQICYTLPSGQHVYDCGTLTLRHNTIGI